MRDVYAPYLMQSEKKDDSGACIGTNVPVMGCEELARLWRHMPDYFRVSRRNSTRHQSRHRDRERDRDRDRSRHRRKKRRRESSSGVIAGSGSRSRSPSSSSSSSSVDENEDEDEDGDVDMNMNKGREGKEKAKKRDRDRDRDSEQRKHINEELSWLRADVGMDMRSSTTKSHLDAKMKRAKKHKGVQSNTRFAFESLRLMREAKPFVFDQCGSTESTVIQNALPVYFADGDADDAREVQFNGVN